MSAKLGTAQPQLIYSIIRLTNLKNKLFVVRKSITAVLLFDMYEEGYIISINVFYGHCADRSAHFSSDQIVVFVLPFIQ